MPLIMPDTVDRSAPPKVLVSRPPEDDPETLSTPSSSALAARRRRKYKSTAVDDEGSPEWTDVDPSPPRHQRSSSKRKHRRSERTTRSSSSPTSSNSQIGKRSSETGIARFLPKLGQILETSESVVTSRGIATGSDRRATSDRYSRRSTSQRDDVSVASYRRPVQHRVGSRSKRPESSFKINPSLLSVLSGLTGVSDKSSSSNTTVTQRSYDRVGGDMSKPSMGRLQRSDLEAWDRKSASNHSSSPHFDIEDGHEEHTYASSSSSSHYEPSDAGSSERPDTPSSRSTFPSPTNTRSGSTNGTVAELRRKYDAQLAASSESVRNNSGSPDSTGRVQRKHSATRGMSEDDEHAENSSRDRTRSSSRASRSSRRAKDELRQQEDAMRHHLAYTQNHPIDPHLGKHRSSSASSAGSMESRQAYAQYMAMQQYQYPSSSQANYQMSASPQNPHLSHPDRPQAPDAPDLTQRTIIGYEQLAVELSNADSSVKPVYRKFEYLNHRILLHLQDELCELEEQLRTVDEIIAQLEPTIPPSDGQHTASRRADAFSGSEIHHRRTHLLGRIFLKAEQYNRSLTAYHSLTKDAIPAAEEDAIHAYRSWMVKHAPIHEVETRFLQCDQDLISPGQHPPPSSTSNFAEDLQQQQYSTTISYRPTKHAALTCLPVALMLPLLLFAIIPTLTGRLVVTALIAVGAFVVAATTRIRHLMPNNEWAVCGAVYVLLMAAIAGCIPQYPGS